MTGRASHGFPAFDAAAARLRELGHEVISPSETAGRTTTLPRSVFFRIDFAYIDAVEAVVVLPEWSTSKGATAESIHATEIGVPIHLYDPVEGVGPQIKVTDWHVTWEKVQDA